MNIDVHHIPIGDIKPNNYNPNVVAPAMLETLDNFIKSSGFLQPILVRPCVDPVFKYEIIDGAHRHQLLVTAGEKEIPCVVVEAEDWEAKIQTIAMNNIKGRMNTKKMNKVISTILSKYGYDKTKSVLGLNDLDMSSIKEEAELSVLAADRELRLEKEDSTIKVAFSLKEDEYLLFAKVLKNFSGNSASKLTSLCAEYTNIHK